RGSDSDSFVLDCLLSEGDRLLVPLDRQGKLVQILVGHRQLEVNLDKLGLEETTVQRHYGQLVLEVRNSFFVLTQFEIASTQIVHRSYNLFRRQLRLDGKRQSLLKVSFGGGKVAPGSRPFAMSHLVVPISQLEVIDRTGGLIPGICRLLSTHLS